MLSSKMDIKNPLENNNKIIQHQLNKYIYNSFCHSALKKLKNFHYINTQIKFLFMLPIFLCALVRC